MSAIDKKTLGAAKSYVKKSLLGGGAVVGKNVIVSSIVQIEGGNRVTFSYTLDDGTVQESYMDVMDGQDGKDGSEITPEQIQEAVDTYLEENPVEAGATEEQAAQIEENKEAIEQLQEDSKSYLTEIPEATTESLGGVILDGDTITIDENGVISAKTGATAEQTEQINQNTEDIGQIQQDLGDCVKTEDFPSYDEVYELLESEVE